MTTPVPTSEGVVRRFEMGHELPLVPTKQAGTSAAAVCHSGTSRVSVTKGRAKPLFAARLRRARPMPNRAFTSVGLGAFIAIS
jgi:hypothetical protein